MSLKTSRSATFSSDKAANRIRNVGDGEMSCSSWLVPILLIFAIIAIFVVWYGYSCQRSKQDEDSVVSNLTGGQSSDNKNSQFPPGQVHDLLPQQLVNLMNQIPVVVAFMADGCGHCKNLKPNYHMASQKSRVPLFTLFAHRDGSDSILRAFNINGFPTICKIYKGKIIDQYQGNRSPDDISRFANKNS